MIASIKPGQRVTVAIVGRELQLVIMESPTIDVLIGGEGMPPLEQYRQRQDELLAARNVADATSGAINHQWMLAVLMAAPVVLVTCGEPPPPARWCRQRQEESPCPVFFQVCIGKALLLPLLLKVAMVAILSYMMAVRVLNSLSMCSLNSLRVVMEMHSLKLADSPMVTGTREIVGSATKTIVTCD